MKSILLILLVCFISTGNFAQSRTPVCKASTHLNENVNLLGMVSGIDCHKTSGGYAIIMILHPASNKPAVSVLLESNDLAGKNEFIKKYLYQYVNVNGKLTPLKKRLVIRLSTEKNISVVNDADLLTSIFPE